MCLVIPQPRSICLALYLFAYALRDSTNLISSTEVGLDRGEGDVLECPLREESLVLRDDEGSPTLGAGTRGTAQTVDVGLLVRRDADLEDVGNGREVHAASNNVGGDEDAASSVAEGIRDLRALGLRVAGVEDGDWG